MGWGIKCRYEDDRDAIDEIDIGITESGGSYYVPDENMHPCKRCMLQPCITFIGFGVKKSDYLVKCNCWPPALFIPIISMIQLIICVVYAAELANTNTPVTFASGYPHYSPLIYLPAKRYEAWRFITYMFIHNGWWHILNNLIFQLGIGLSLEMVHKWWRVMIVYLCGVIAGCLLHSVIEHDLALVGASAGAFTLVGAHLAVVITNWKEMRMRCDCECLDKELKVPTGPFRLTVILPLVFYEVGRAIYQHVVDKDSWRIAVGAHLGGIATGILLGVPILKNMQRHPWETRLGIVTSVVFGLAVLFGILFNIFYKGYPETDWD
ncbi:rhomboid-related protein 2-like [Haliotis asinina]|uniref:rhomboid-related protein 2-like n=1 Tax=Haliotis asinina TaxID=109174 RepID=UPI0035327D88